jgi:hypothetical protein
VNVLGSLPMDGEGDKTFDLWAALRAEGLKQSTVGKLVYVKGPFPVR